MRAAKENRRPPLTTLATRLTRPTARSSKSAISNLSVAAMDGRLVLIYRSRQCRRRGPHRGAAGHERGSRMVRANHVSELQAGFAGGIGHRCDTTVIEEPTAVEHDRGH